MTESAIVATSLGKRYGHKWGLRNCSFAIPRGRVVGLVGPNGAGKSTLMNLMVGLLRPTEGDLELFGDKVTASTALERVAYIDQEHTLYRSFKVAEMLKAGQALNQRWDEQIALRRLRELTIPMDAKVGQLSVGQRAQVALALALARRPELLILDEPVAGLDPLARREVMAALMEAKSEQDCTVMLSSHVVSELERVCDYLVVLSHGEVRVAGDVDELLDEHRLLIGPASSAGQLAAGQQVVHREIDDEKISLLVRGDPPLTVPSCRSERISLETLVVRYLSSAGLPTPINAAKWPYEAVGSSG